MAFPTSRHFAQKPTPADPDVRVLNMSDLTKTERYRLEQAVAPRSDPAVVLERKIQMLARLLDCDEASATETFLHLL